MVIALFDIESVAFHLGEYAVSYVELIGTIAGMISVFFAARSNVLTWPTGIVNEIFLFALFFQLHLYADMFLQVFFFVVTVYGWYSWRRNSGELKITRSSGKQQVIIAAAAIAGTLLFGIFFRYIHVLLPALFTHEAAYPFADSFIMVSSMIATWLLARKKLESWILWIMVDAVAVVVYALKSAWVLSGEYLIFMIIAGFGYYNWRRLLQK